MPGSNSGDLAEQFVRALRDIRLSVRYFATVQELRFPLASGRSGAKLQRPD
jgi:hypothetical protein